MEEYKTITPRDVNLWLILSLYYSAAWREAQKEECNFWPPVCLKNIYLELLFW